MHSNAATVLALLPAFSFALSIVPRNASVPTGSNLCDTSTVIYGTSWNITGAPIGDCQALANSISTDQTLSVAQSWGRPWNYGSCALSVRVKSGSGPILFSGADAIDLLNDSISNAGKGGSVSSKRSISNVRKDPSLSLRRSYNGTVSADGQVDCNTPQGGNSSTVKVEWIVASSAYNPLN